MAYQQATHTFETEEAASNAVQAGWTAQLFVRWTPETKQISVMGGTKEVQEWKANAEKTESEVRGGGEQSEASEEDPSSEETGGGEGGGVQ